MKYKSKYSLLLSDNIYMVANHSSTRDNGMVSVVSPLIIAFLPPCIFNHFIETADRLAGEDLLSART